MPYISQLKVAAHRKKTFRLLPALKLKSRKGALSFVNERKFIFFWPIKGTVMPSLWSAVAGMRPVPFAHDDPAHVTWGWKDGMLDKRKWYYAKVLRGKATIIALDTVPYFIALTKTYGDPELDCRMLYNEGILSPPAKTIYEGLMEGPLDTFNLRKKIHLAGKEFNSQFDRGLVELQRHFKILPVGVAETGRWGYSFIFDLVYRYWPDLVGRSADIEEGQAQRHLALTYFKSVGAATEQMLQRVFRWETAIIRSVLRQLVEAGALTDGYGSRTEPGEHYLLSELAG